MGEPSDLWRVGRVCRGETPASFAGSGETLPSNRAFDRVDRRLLAFARSIGAGVRVLRRRSPQDWWRPAEAARRADVHINTMRRWATEHGLGRRLGRQWRIDPERLEAFLNEGPQKYRA